VAGACSGDRDHATGNLCSDLLLRADTKTDIVQPLDFHDGVLAIGEDEHVLPDAQPFSPRPRTDPAETLQHPVPRPHEGEDEIPSTAISAPHRRARAPKALEMDERPGLTNDELRQWNEGYLNNMREALDARYPYKLGHQAKKNAEHWVLGQGIGGVGTGLGQDHAAGPLHFFSGVTLLAALIGRDLSSAGTKHARSSSVTSAAEDDERRVRAREEEGEKIGRPAGEEDLTLAGQDEGVFIGGNEMVR
jgi:meiotic recombination protein REC8, fungi type